MVYCMMYVFKNKMQRNRRNVITNSRGQRRTLSFTYFCPGMLWLVVSVVLSVVVQVTDCVNEGELAWGTGFGRIMGGIIGRIASSTW